MPFKGFRIATPLKNSLASELVQTPAGVLPKSNIHAVPHGALVHQTAIGVQVIASNGTILHFVPIPEGKPDVGLLPRLTSNTIGRRNLPNGYLAQANWGNKGTSPISFFSTNWTVPPTPASWDGQLLYWFNGIEPSSGVGILQPVLQYGLSGIGGGRFYSIASWWLIGNHGYHTNPIEVSPGTSLQGLMTLTGTLTSGNVTTYNYESTFVGFPNTTISASSTEELKWAFEVLEVYNTKSVSDLPIGNTVFSGINVTFQNGQQPSSIPWTTINHDATDGITMKILSSSGSNGSLLLTY
ncbi:hypothetical protein CPB84DRAFT_1749487 [Gymnopilus junonius]|uniref:Uncharacterized protein n=1 Tax=Gymnopilus junonius TaxID=109634 RepID=A0A9P5TKU9_GYMJU|nr:hypothetical protein CPB84DRAFT_1749487 [Gymnopilus junonius]